MRSNRFSEARLLVIDDEEPQLRLMRVILERAGYHAIRTESDPRQAVPAFIDFKADMILLDLHMPGVEGIEVLDGLNGCIEAGAYLPVVVISGDLTSSARHQALARGAKDFITKPFDPDEVLLRIHNLLETRSLYDELRDHSVSLERAVERRTRELWASRVEVVERLAMCGEFRDDITGEHTRRVGSLAASLAAAMGMRARTVELLRQAAQLHDIGKIGISDAILHKPGPLTNEEFEIMKTHTLIGGRILANGRSELVRMAQRVAIGHHERWDGTGYPHGATGDSIPIEARIVTAADIVDALGHDRPYRTAWDDERILAFVQENSGCIFDPGIAETFQRLRLQNGREPSERPNLRSSPRTIR